MDGSQEVVPMATSTATTVDQYLAELSPGRREAIFKVRKVVLEHLPAGYEETMQFGMISYVIPLEKYPVTYNKQALGIASLASQKNYMSLYLMCVYGDKETERWFFDRYAASGKKLNMGKSCVRFKRVEDLPLDLIGETIARVTPAQFIEIYEEARRGMK